MTLVWLVEAMWDMRGHIWVGMGRIWSHWNHMEAIDWDASGGPDGWVWRPWEHECSFLEFEFAYGISISKFQNPGFAYGISISKFQNPEFAYGISISKFESENFRFEYENLSLEPVLGCPKYNLSAFWAALSTICRHAWAALSTVLGSVLGCPKYKLYGVLGCPKYKSPKQAGFRTEPTHFSQFPHSSQGNCAGTVWELWGNCGEVWSTELGRNLCNSPTPSTST